MCVGSGDTFCLFEKNLRTLPLVRSVEHRYVSWLTLIFSNTETNVSLLRLGAEHILYHSQMPAISFNVPTSRISMRR